MIDAIDNRVPRIMKRIRSSPNKDAEAKSLGIKLEGFKTTSQSCPLGVDRTIEFFALLSSMGYDCDDQQ